MKSCTDFVSGRRFLPLAISAITLACGILTTLYFLKYFELSIYGSHNKQILLKDDFRFLEVTCATLGVFVGIVLILVSCVVWAAIIIESRCLALCCRLVLIMLCLLHTFNLVCFAAIYILELESVKSDVNNGITSSPVIYQTFWWKLAEEMNCCAKTPAECENEPEKRISCFTKTINRDTMKIVNISMVLGSAIVVMALCAAVLRYFSREILRIPQKETCQLKRVVIKQDSWHPTVATIDQLNLSIPTEVKRNDCDSAKPSESSQKGALPC